MVSEKLVEEFRSIAHSLDVLARDDNTFEYFKNQRSSLSSRLRRLMSEYGIDEDKFIRLKNSHGLSGLGLNEKPFQPTFFTVPREEYYCQYE